MNDKSTQILITRIDRFMERVAREILGDHQPFAAHVGWSREPVPFGDRLKLEYKPIHEGETWGHAWESAWFHLEATVPKEWAGREVVAHLDVGGEGLVVLPSGDILMGISNGSVFVHDFNRDIVPLLDTCEGGEAVDLWVEGAANALFGLFTEQDPAEDSPKRYGEYEARAAHLAIATFDRALWHLWLDLRTIRGLIKRLPEKSVRRARLVHTTNRAIDRYADDPSNATACRNMLADELGKRADASAPTAVAIGHAHIDTAWLWPIRETVRKCVRTFSSQLDLIDRYPEYIFGASQPQHYAFVKQHYPRLYERIRKAVKSGRWEVQGAMWVEADCNLISGESMVRQVVHGKNFFKDEFGVEVDNLWLPDVFGYSAALPQILQRAGVKYFLTQKLSWSQINDFPHTTFRWRGIDGSEVLAHFPPENNYVSQLDPEFLIPGMENFRERGYLGEFLSLYGVGDGGGGPKAENIELGRRMHDLEGTPKVRFGTAKRFFERLAEHEQKLPSWTGELYLELHRGTLTTQAALKRGNRRLEEMLRTLELFWSALPLEQYPAQTLDALWKTTLLHQFHDILPGSSITVVNRQAREAHAEALEKGSTLLEEALGKLFTTEQDAITVVNSSQGLFFGPVELPEGWAGHEVLGPDDRQLEVQDNGGTAVALVEAGAWETFTLRKGAKRKAVKLPESGLVLENDLVRWEFDRNGALVRGYHKVTGREVLALGEKANVLTLYDDHPNDWDAWDIDGFYENAVIEEAHVVAMEPCPAGPVQQSVRFRFEVGNSEIEQIVTLATGDTLLRFDTHVQWRESHRMLRVAFPVNVQVNDASFDIQYGFVQRPTHRNTSWDTARFEVVAHRYADLSDHDFGVALLNDGKYGHKVHGCTLDLNLLRAPSYPDPDADRGEHHFTYALYPHSGDLIDSDTIERAAQLNGRIHVLPGVAGDMNSLPWRLDGAGISLEVVKRAEKRNDTLVLRLVETRGRRSSGALHLQGEGWQITECDLMEWRTFGDPRPCGTEVPLVLHPFEIRTYLLKRSV